MGSDKYCTLPRRFAAGLVDLTPIAPFLVADFIFKDLPEGHWFSLSTDLGASVVSAAYFIVMHARTGQTLGKRLFGVRVVRAADESGISWKQSVLRETPSLLFLTGFAAFDLTLFAFGIAHAPTWVMIAYTIVYRLSDFWNLGDALCTLFNSKRRSFHDYVGQTVVIRTG
jgi:uncharacterized RDD family membrane protein YckC